ncbi:MAG: 50S ribosomal protein L24 [Acidobacteria bacterium]|nr:50S ribosomal protein L24 [Acidobacteriota bacterium]MDA1233780.1 50S ribosomal protein L24 [Acidobacteriota bacterium]
MPAQKQQAAVRTRLVKEDIVEAIAGKSKGKRGRVLAIDRKNGRVLVEHLMMIKKHVRPNPQKQIKGGIAEREAYFNISNVMIVCPDDGPVRIGTEVSADGTRTRVCRKCGKPLEKKKAK